MPLTGAQGKVSLGCPKPTQVAKQIPLRSYNAFKIPSSDRCKLYKLLNKLASSHFHPPPNLLFGTSCEICDKDLFVIQTLVHGISVRDWLGKCFSSPIEETKSKEKCKEDMADLVMIIIQVLGTIWWLYTHNFYHNDVSSSNVILGSWPSGVTQYEYTICQTKFLITKEQCPLCAYLIDYDLMTQDYPLNDNRIAQTKVRNPFWDICQFLHYFLLYPGTEPIQSYQDVLSSSPRSRKQGKRYEPVL